MHLQCILCHQKTRWRQPFCPACIQDLPAIGQACHRCYLPLEFNNQAPGFATGTLPEEEKNPHLMCGNCQHTPPSFDQCYTPYLYDFPIDQMIIRMKYHNTPSLCRSLSQLFAGRLSALRTSLTDSSLPEALIPIPMHWRKLRSRGFNQSELIAKYLSKQLDIPVRHWLLKDRDTQKQNRLNRSDRQQNLQNVFKLSPRVSKKGVNLRHVALVDDVVTTGATGNQAAIALKGAGIERVDLWALARTPKDTP